MTQTDVANFKFAFLQNFTLVYLKPTDNESFLTFPDRNFASPFV